MHPVQLRSICLFSFKKMSIYYLFAYFLGRPRFNKLNKFLYNLALRGMGVYNYQDMRISGEFWFIKNVLKRSGDDLVVFDVGANIGGYSKEILRNNVSIKKIYAFEPHSSTYEKLLVNATHQQIQAVNFGLSDQECTATLYDRAYAGGSRHASLSEEIFSVVHRVETESMQINLTTVDSFCRVNKIEFIDLLKIDVEGYEINVLRGAHEMLQAGKVGLIQFEFTQLNSGLRVFFKDFLELLGDNYHIYRLLPHGVERIKSYNPTFHEIFGYQNFICELKK